MNRKQRDALAAGLIYLAAALEVEDGDVTYNDGDVGSILTSSGDHDGLASSEMRNLADDILERRFP